MRTGSCVPVPRRARTRSQNACCQYRTRADRPYPNYPPYLLGWNAQLVASELPYDATPAGRALADALQGHRSV